MKTFATALTALALFVGPAAAQHNPMSGDKPMAMRGVVVTAAWARATPGAAGAGGAYVSIANMGGNADRLIAVRSDVARRVELHTHIMDGNVMRMRKVDGIDLPPGGSVTMKPGGYHVMLMGLKAPLKEGDSFPLTLVLQSGKTIPVTVSVLKIGAMGPAGHGPGGVDGMHGNGDMGGMHDHGDMGGMMHMKH